MSNQPTSSPLRLSQLTAGISETLQQAFSDLRFWVIADITNHSFKAEKNYHNFDMVEKESGSANLLAKVSAKAWGIGARQISTFEAQTGQRFTNNIQVLALVAVEYHPVYGLSLNLLDVDTNFTLGVLQQQRKATLERLVSENEFISKLGDTYLTHNNSLVLKPVIQKIALLSSSISAGAEDFKHTLENNSFGYTYRIDEYFSSVQGDKNAGQFLSKLIEIFNSGIAYDAVVITRGGGAQTDFLLFDNYRIARAVAKFPVPIITGIGHQKDQSITDLMVHTQTKTPTKAAEFIIAHNRTFEQGLLSLQKDILIATQQLLSAHNKSLADTRHSILIDTKDTLARGKERLSSMNHEVAGLAKGLLHLQNRKLLQVTSNMMAGTRINLANRNNEINAMTAALKRGSLSNLKSRNSQLDNFSTTVKLMSPSNILKKGYALVKVNGTIVSNAELIEKGTTIEVVLSETHIRSTVINKTENGTDTNL